MAHFDLSQKIKTEKELNAEEIKAFIKEHLRKPCKFKVVSEDGSSMKIKGAAQEVVFTPMTNFNATFTIRAEKDKARMEIIGNSSPNWIFWLFIIIGLFTFGTFIVIGIVLFLLQMNKPRKVLEDLLKSFDSEYGVL